MWTCVIPWLLAQVTGLQVGEFIHTFGDAHIYANHLLQVDEQLSRKPYALPRLWIDPALTSIDGVQSQHVKLIGYEHHSPLPGEVAV